jgi:hypothetical protein
MKIMYDVNWQNPVNVKIWEDWQYDHRWCDEAGRCKVDKKNINCIHPQYED